MTTQHGISILTKKLKPSVAAVACMAAMAGTASASPITVGDFTVSAQLAPSGNTPFSLVQLGQATTQGLQSTLAFSLSGESFQFNNESGRTPLAGVYAGDIANVVRSPFDPPPPASPQGAPYSDYLAAEPSNSVTITFARPQTVFDLLWGSVDTYNGLSFSLDGQVITGADIASALSPSGIQYGTSNVAVEITDNASSFRTVDLISNQAAFEFVPGEPVPEPSSFVMLGVSLLSLGMFRRKRR